MSPDTFVLTCFVIVLLAFLLKAIYGRYKRRTLTGDDRYNEQVLASKSVSSWKIAMSTAATYSAFATVFFWLVTLGGDHSWMLFLIPVCLYCGNFLFVHMVRRLSIPLGTHLTIGGFVRDNSTCKPLHYVLDWVVVVFAFSAVLVELVIGSGILATMVPRLPHAQLTIFMSISVVVLVYVIIGGIRAVIDTDAWQFWLATASALLLVVYAFVFVSPDPGMTQFVYPPRVTVSGLAAFILSVLTVQFLGPLCKLHNWHRLATARNREDALRGQHNGALLGAILWTLMVIAALALNARTAGQITFGGIFDHMKSHGFVGEYLFYPSVFVGLVAAMISTADSAMAALFSFFYDSVHREKPDVELTLGRDLGLGACLFLVMLGVYVANQTDLLDFAITVIYFLFNQLLVAFPALLFLAVERKRREAQSCSAASRQSSHLVLALGVALGWFTVLALSAAGHLSGELMWTMFASISGVVVSSLVICFAIPGLLRSSVPDAGDH